MKISSSNPDERKTWEGSIFYDSRPSTSPYTFQNIYVGHLHFISRKCHILTSNTLSWHLFFETLYSASSALYHLLCVSISTRFDWPIKRAIFHCIVSILSSLLLRRSFGSSPPPEPVLGARTRDEPPRTSTWETRIAAALWEKWALFPRFSPTRPYGARRVGERTWGRGCPHSSPSLGKNRESGSRIQAFSTACSGRNSREGKHCKTVHSKYV